MRSRVRCLLAGCLLLAACGDTGESRPPLPEGFVPEGAGSGKADAVTKWFTTIKGPAAVGAGIKGTTGAAEWFHGYTLELVAGDRISIQALADSWGLLGLYGPRAKNGQYGTSAALGWIEPDGKVYRGAIATFSAPKAGTYLVVVGSPWFVGYGYALKVACLGGSCKKSYCVEYETVDGNGQPLRNYYALNFGTYAEAKQELSLVPDAIGTAITAGTCAAQSQVCPKIVAQPVCGEPAGGLLAQTYASACSFKAAIRQLAGAKDRAKGHWDPGACQGYCVVWEAADQNGNPQGAFYAVNVATYQQGKDKLAQVGWFLNEAIHPGSCGSQLIDCPAVDQPVCADTPTTVPLTFESLCVFKAEVVRLAGETGEHKGKWTKGACVCDPKTEWWRQYKFAPPTCAVVKYLCQPHTLYFSSNCGCGCEQDPSCPEWINCEPPATPTCLSLKTKCPYSKIAL